MPALPLPIDCFFLAADCGSQLVAVQSSVTYARGSIPEYILGHDLKGEGNRLALMSELLDPRYRRFLQSLNLVYLGAWTLELGRGNGSGSAWLARQIETE